MQNLQRRTHLIIPCVVAFICSAFTLAAQTKQYSGKIGKNLQIWLTIKQEGKVLSGLYCYEKNGNFIDLNGTIAADGNTLLIETLGKDTTGCIRGMLSKKGEFTGVWFKPDGTKPLPCTFKQHEYPPKWDSISGTYIRLGKDSATLWVELQKDGRVRVEGRAFWKGDPKTGNIHVAEISFLQKPTRLFNGLKYDNPLLTYEDVGVCNFDMHFNNGAVEIDNERGNCGGAYVTMSGRYKRVGNPPKVWDMLDSSK
ncbi:MAG: hypothetical protein ACOVSW_16350 [Candidatus Kapaibacteriota bacterium]|jgi:hypothetical protein